MRRLERLIVVSRRLIQQEHGNLLSNEQLGFFQEQALRVVGGDGLTQSICSWRLNVCCMGVVGIGFNGGQDLTLWDTCRVGSVVGVRDWSRNERILGSAWSDQGW